jgi:hypothetical protein
MLPYVDAWGRQVATKSWCRGAAAVHPLAVRPFLAPPLLLPGPQHLSGFFVWTPRVTMCPKRWVVRCSLFFLDKDNNHMYTSL